MRFFEKGDGQENASRHLVGEMIRAMWEQGLVEEDILSILARLGMPGDAAVFTLEKVMEKIEVAGIEGRQSILRREVEEALWGWAQEIETRTRGDLAKVENRLFSLEKELKLLRQMLEKACPGSPQE